MNYLRFVYFLSFLFISAQSMEQTALSPIYIVPKPVLAKTLGYLYIPDQWNHTRQIIRFLRTAKSFYNSEELAREVMKQLPVWNLFPSQTSNNWMESTFDLGTTTAIKVLSNYLTSQNDLFAIHIKYGSMIFDNQRIAGILKKAGASLDAMIPEMGSAYYEPAFFRLFRTCYTPEEAERILEENVNVNATNSYGSNLIMILMRDLAEKDAVALIPLLIKKRININYCVNGRSILNLANLRDKRLIAGIIAAAGGKDIHP